MRLYSLLRHVPVIILAGKLKGKIWFLGCGKIFRFLTTTYESCLTQMFIKLIKEGNVVFDIGAHVGYFTLLASVLVKDSGKVISFEPLTSNYSMIKKHMKINNCKNVTVLNMAVSDKTGTSFFEVDTCGGQWAGKLTSRNTNYVVNTISLDDFVYNTKIKPDFIKIDVEGSEFEVLKGGEKLLMNSSPTIFLSLHSEKTKELCDNFLKSLGYSIKFISRDIVICWKNKL